MAETAVRRLGEKGAVPTWALAALALLLTAALMAWLAMTAEPSSSGTMVVEEEVDSAAVAAAQVPGVPIEVFEDSARQYVGREIRIASAPVDSRMGTRGFWLKMPNQGLYLVRAPVATSLPQAGQNVQIVGQVVEMSDSVVTSWLEDGSMTQNDEIAARYATTFIDASYVGAGAAEAANQAGGAGAAGSAGTATGAGAAGSADATGSAATAQ